MDTKNAKNTMLCSEILNLHLQYEAGRERELKANLEEIWSSGALLLTDVRVPLSAPTWFAAGGREFRGKVAARKFLQGLGYFIEVQFASNSYWSEQKYRPKHLFNPLVLLANKILATSLIRPLVLLKATCPHPSSHHGFQAGTPARGLKRPLLLGPRSNLGTAS
jgi:hypothetical protein